MTPAEIKLDCYRSWLFALAMLACDCDTERALPLFDLLKQKFGVA